MIAEGLPLGAVLTTAPWADVGTPERFLAAHEDLLAGRFLPEFPWPGADHVLVGGAPGGGGGPGATGPSWRRRRRRPPPGRRSAGRCSWMERPDRFPSEIDGPRW